MTRQQDIVLKIILKYQGKEYECEGYCWYDEECEENRSCYEFDGVRTCEHDYASLLPEEVASDKEFGCEQKEIEVIDYWFFDKKNNKKVGRYEQTTTKSNSPDV